VEFVEPEGWLVTRFVEGEIPPTERMSGHAHACRAGTPCVRRPTDSRQVRLFPRGRALRDHARPWRAVPGIRLGA
jgi:hypothetical protein